MTTYEKTAVVIIGGGVAGLTLAMFLRQADVPCIVLERRDLTYIQGRQRAGVVDARNVRIFEQRGLADRLLAGPVAQAIDYRLNGESRVFQISKDTQSESRFCTQQMLVNNLLRELLDARAADIRFDVRDVKIVNEEDAPARVTYIDDGGTRTITCAHIAGCDADRGVSRASIPAGVITSHTHDFGYAWVAALVEAPVEGAPIMGVSDHGFVAQIPRGPQRSRFYLQCPLSDGPEDWPDERLWHEIRLRLNDDTIGSAVVHDKQFVPLRSVVHTPMQYRNLFLAGDAAHLVPPTGAKGMNLALRDVEVLAQALTAAVCHGDPTGLADYSDTALAAIWKYADFSSWMTDTLHDAGDSALGGTFRQMTARARLAELFTSPSAASMHSDYLHGLA